MMRSDVELMLKAKAGSTVAFDWLVKRHFKPVVQFFYWRLWDKSQAEDLAQEVFIKLFQNLHNYDPRGQFKSYLFSIATNHLRDHMRRVKVRPSLVSLSGAGGDDGDDGDLLDKLTAVEMPPDANLELDETAAKLAQALTELPEDQYLVFSMHKHEGLKYEEISEALGIKLGTVKSRMNTVYQHLRRAVFGAEQELPVPDVVDGVAASATTTTATAATDGDNDAPTTAAGSGSRRGGSKRTNTAKKSGLRPPRASKRTNTAKKSGLKPPKADPADPDDAPEPVGAADARDSADGDGMGDPADDTHPAEAHSNGVRGDDTTL
ncbi:MAG: RNA polymerase sigma factor [Planctomycetota bacterium]